MRGKARGAKKLFGVPLVASGRVAESIEQEHTLAISTGGSPLPTSFCLCLLCSFLFVQAVGLAESFNSFKKRSSTSWIVFFLDNHNEPVDYGEKIEFFHLKYSLHALAPNYIQ